MQTDKRMYVDAYSVHPYGVGLCVNKYPLVLSGEIPLYLLPSVGLALSQHNYHSVTRRAYMYTLHVYGYIFIYASRYV